MKEHTETYALFTGAATALATPFADGEIDLAAFERLVEWQIDMGIDALCVAGTTGEAATLSRGEHRRLLGAARALSAGKVPLIAGCGSADTKAACALTADAVACGADALLAITPYCNKGTADGILEHYRRIADAASGRPVILYNIPSRTGVNLTEAQYAALADIPNIRAVKEASGNMAKLARLCADGRLAVYSGSDDQILPVAALGGRGVISVLSNLAPAAVSAMAHAAVDSDFDTARHLAYKYARLISLLFAETNPAPLKYAMELLGLSRGELRLPLAEIGDGLKAALREELTALGML